MKISRYAIALCLGLGGALPLTAQQLPTDWYEESTLTRPFVRWWWLGSAVDPEGLTFNLSEMADKGLGGVEITPIYGVKGNEANDIPYLSDKWMDMLAHTTAEARRLGLQVDMNNGTGWPFGGPEVTTDDAAKKYIVEKFTTGAKRRVEEAIRPADPRQRGVARLQHLLAVSPDGKQRINVTEHLKNDTVLTWRAPKGEPWTVYALFCGPTFQMVKRAAPGGEGYVVNHYDSLAVKRYLAKFDRAFEGRENLTPTSFFNDSYEVYGSSWTDNFLAEFEADHGYRLESFLPEFVDEENHTGIRPRIIRDYRTTLARLLRDNFTDVWTRWAHSHGATIRNQSHGSPANILDIYAAVDIPECESFGKSDFDIPGLHATGPSRPSDADPAVLKFASSAAHLAGRPLTSAETLTWLTEHFHTSLARCKPEIDQMLCSGVNHVYFHGAPYSPAHEPFPGWLFYASINVSPTNSFWQDAPGLFRYISRTQAALSAGTPDNDFLLFFPFEDIITRQGGTPYLMFDIHKMDQRMPDVKAAVAEVMGQGFDVDYLSDALIDMLAIDPSGRLLSRGGNKYNAIIVPPMKVVKPETLASLLQKARAGATVIFVGELPADVPGLSDLAARQDALSEILKLIPQGNGIHAYGKGRLIMAPTITEALAQTGVKGEPLRRDGLHMIRRTNEAGGHNYFISLLRNAPIDGWVNLAVPSASAMLFDPLTGESGKAQTRAAADGTTDLRLRLQPGQSILVKTFPTDVEAADWTYFTPAGEPVAIERGWSISFPQSDPEIAETFATDTLTAWTSLPDERVKVNSATGRYTVTFDFDPATADDWLLSLGDVCESARVNINGTDVTTLWAVPFETRVGRFLRKGKNTLTVDVTNLQANRIADFERRGVEWRRFKDANVATVTGARTFSFADWPTVPSGLNSQVTLTPISYK